ncbi:MAG: hypothetical protein PVI03_03015 [Candidatus Thorarchaeota archaeon]|jgi:hypothetical protein
MSTSFNTIVDDLKSSFGLAKDNILSYFLANLGMLIAVALLLGLVMVPILVAALLLVGTNPATWEAVGLGLAAWAESNPWAVGGVAILFFIPFVALFLTVVGSIYGMSKDLIAHGETKAERAFSWFRHKFLTFAGAGVLLTIIIILPPVVVWGSISILMGYSIPVSLVPLLSVSTFVWVFLTVGLCAMVFPAITYGKGVQDAFKESFQLARERFDHVYGLLSAIVVLAVASYGPVIMWGLTVPFSGAFMAFDAVAIAIMVWTVFVTFLWLLVLLPMTIIAFTKVYAEMTGGQVATQKPLPIPLV